MNTTSAASNIQLAPEWMKQRKPTKKTSSSTLGSKPNTPVSVSQSETPPTTGSASLEEEVARPTTSTQHSYNSNSATGPQMTYSSLVAGSDVSPGQNVGGAKLDDDDDARLPFRYSKEQMLQVWRDGGGQGELNIEVERWPGIVRELVVEPAGLREWTAEERKLFSEPLNPSHSQNYGYSSSARRHTQTLGSIQTSSTGLARNSFAGGLGSPRTERFSQSPSSALGSPSGPFSSASRRKKEDAGAADVPGPLYRPRQPSFSNLGSHGQTPASNNHSSSLRRLSNEGIGGDSWIRRRPSEKLTAPLPSALEDSLDAAEGDGLADVDEVRDGVKGLDVNFDIDPPPQENPGLHESPPETQLPELSQVQQPRTLHSDLDVSSREHSQPAIPDSNNLGPPPGITIKNEDVKWRYKDPSGQMQGPFDSEMMCQWHNANYFSPDLLIQRFDPLWDPLNPDLFEPLIEYLRRLPAEHQSTLFLRGLELQKARSPLPRAASTVETVGAYQPPQNGLNLGLREESPMNDLYSPNHIYQSNLNGPDRFINSRHGSFDSFGNSGPQSLQIPSAHGSPAFTDAQTRGYGSQNGSLADDRSRREPWFNTRDDTLIPSRNASLGVAPSSGLYGDSIGGQLSRSPYPGTSPLASHQTAAGYPSNHLTYRSHTSNVGPRLTQNLFTQQPSSSRHAYQSAPPVNAWSQPPSGHIALARQAAPAPRPPRLLEDPLMPMSTAPSWGNLEPPRSSGLSNGWIADKMHIGNEPLEWKISAFDNDAERYSTSVALQQVQSQSAGNFGLPKGYIEPTAEHFVVQTEAPAPPPYGITADSVPNPPVLPIIPTVGGTNPPVSMALSHDSQKLGTISVAQPSIAKPSSPVEAKPPPLPKPSKTKSAPTPVAIRSHPEMQRAAAPEPATEPPQPSKPAWGSTPVAQVSGNSLREIQEAEAKKAEARKVAEQKEKAARAGASTQAPTPAEEVTKVASWGLPHVGQKNSTVPTTPPSVTSVAPPAHTAWSTPSAKPSVKKSMKEIQEEEERKKAQGASSALSASISDAAFLSAAARRETIRPAELPKPTAPTGGSAWAVVGPGGKHIPSPAVTSPTPIATTSNRSSAVNARSASTVSSTPAARPTTAAASTTSTTPSSSGGNAKKVDVKMHPSVDFMRWLRDALRGLNHGVSVEEFITMLFDLPLDPDLSMLDVISDFVYANSSTMDGRRFASEFVNKRKADSAKVSQMGNGGVGAGSASNGSESGKSVSLADVVKSQPKPAQPDWGYKVVTKKKGKRS